MRIRRLLQAAGLAYLAVQTQQSVEQFAIEDQVRTRRFCGRIEPQGGVDLATAQVFAENAPDFRFQAAEFFRHPEPDFQVAVIDRPQFPGQAPEIVEALDAGKSCHASDHDVFPCLVPFLPWQLLPDGGLGTMVPANAG